MGYVLFTSSGTFKPADYGLAPGDTIQIVAIGGGAGGAATLNFGSAGSASSFGSILTAPGGTACTAQSSSGALSEGMLPGTARGLTFRVNNTSTVGCDGQGGPGWMPGEPRKYFELFSQVQVNASTGEVTGGTAFWQGAASSFIQVAASIIPFGAASATIVDRNNIHGGVGGRGYGAGGGGFGGSIGGNSGALRQASYTLPNTNNIAVTVGNGGNGGSGPSSNPGQTGGGGARGCVAVFW